MKDAALRPPTGERGEEDLDRNGSGTGVGREMKRPARVPGSQARTPAFARAGNRTDRAKREAQNRKKSSASPAVSTISTTPTRSVLPAALTIPRFFMDDYVATT
jgi:hypothetical protein